MKAFCPFVNDMVWVKLSGVGRGFREIRELGDLQKDFEKVWHLPQDKIRMFVETILSLILVISDLLILAANVRTEITVE